MSLVISVIKYLSFHINKEKAARILCENILAAFCLASQLQLISYQSYICFTIGLFPPELRPCLDNSSSC